MVSDNGALRGERARASPPVDSPCAMVIFGAGGDLDQAAGRACAL